MKVITKATAIKKKEIKKKAFLEEISYDASSKCDMALVCDIFLALYKNSVFDSLLRYQLF